MLIRVPWLTNLIMCLSQQMYIATLVVMNVHLKCMSPIFACMHEHGFAVQHHTSSSCLSAQLDTRRSAGGGKHFDHV